MSLIMLRLAGGSRDLFKIRVGSCSTKGACVRFTGIGERRDCSRRAYFGAYGLWDRRLLWYNEAAWWWGGGGDIAITGWDPLIRVVESMCFRDGKLVCMVWELIQLVWLNEVLVLCGEYCVEWS